MTARPNHPLARWMKRAGISMHELSRRSGVATETISRVLGGERRRFSAEAAFAIETATDGEVAFADLWRPSLKHKALSRRIQKGAA